MADYRDRTDAFFRAGYRVAAVSVDEPQRTEHLRRTLSVSFPILCDVERQVVRDWDLFNPHEKGGIAVPATFVLDGERRVRLSSIDGVRHRAAADEVQAFVRSLHADTAATVMVCTHDLEEAEALCSRVLMLDRGRIVADGTALELRARYGETPHAPLEDVFLRLTGRSFGDDGDDDEVVP